MYFLISNISKTRIATETSFDPICSLNTLLDGAWKKSCAKIV